MVDLEQIGTGVSFGDEQIIEGVPPMIENRDEIRPLLIRKRPVNSNGETLFKG